jgi:hypothetical protein
VEKTCFYHAGCPDGFGAAWAVWRAWGDEAEFRARSHDDRLPMSSLHDRLVVFVDISVDNGQLAELSEVAGEVVLLDHHVSAQSRYHEDLGLVNRMDEAGHEILYDLSHSGAVLAWQYFHPDHDVPDLLAYVEDQDLWNWKLPGSAEVNAAIASYPRDFQVWAKLAQRDVEELIQEGTPIVRANQMEVERSLKNAAPIRIGERQVEGVNASVNRSAIGHELAKRACFGDPWGCVYRISGQQVHATLYSIGDLDVAQICAGLGGGGHRNAAGFTTSLAEWVEKYA